MAIYSDVNIIVANEFVKNTTFGVHYIESIFDEYLSRVGPKNAQDAIQKTVGLAGSPLSHLGADTVPGLTGVVPEEFTTLPDQSSIKNSFMDHVKLVLGYDSGTGDLDLSKFVQILSKVRAHATSSLAVMEPAVTSMVADYPPNWEFSDLMSGGLVRVMKDRTRINDLGTALLNTGKFYDFAYTNLVIAGTPQDLAINLIKYDTTGITEAAFEKAKLYGTPGTITTLHADSSSVQSEEDKKKIVEADTAVKGTMIPPDYSGVTDPFKQTSLDNTSVYYKILNASNESIISVLETIYGEDMKQVFIAMGATINDLIFNMSHVLVTSKMIPDVADDANFRTFDDIASIIRGWPDIGKITSTTSLINAITFISYRKYPLLDAFEYPMDPNVYNNMVAIYGVGTGDYDSVTVFDMIGSLIGHWVSSGMTRVIIALEKIAINDRAIEADRLFKIASDVMDGVYDNGLVITIPGMGDYNTPEEVMAALAPLIQTELVAITVAIPDEVAEIKAAFDIIPNRILLEENYFSLAGINIEILRDNVDTLSVQFGMAIQSGISGDAITETEILYTTLARPDTLGGQAVLAAIDEIKLSTRSIY